MGGKWGPFHCFFENITTLTASFGPEVQDLEHSLNYTVQSIVEIGSASSSVIAFSLLQWTENIMTSLYFMQIRRFPCAGACVGNFMESNLKFLFLLISLALDDAEQCSFHIAHTYLI